MPRVPIQIAPTVGLQPIIGVGPGAVGTSGVGRLGAGISEAAQGIGQLGGAVAEAERRAEEAAEMEASAALETYGTTLYDDDEAGLLHTHGRAAFEQTDEVLGKLEKERQRLMQGMSPGARARFDLRTRSYMEMRRRQGENHAAVQRRVVEGVAVDNRLKASLVTLRQTDDPEVRERAIAVGLDAIQAFESDPDLLEKATGEYLEMAHGAALDRMLAKRQVAEAKSYFAEHGPKLGASAMKYQAAIASIDLEHQALALADGIIEEAVDQRSGDVLDDVIQARLRTIKDPDLRSLTRQYLGENVRDAIAAKRERVDELYNRLRSSLIERQSRRYWNASDLRELQVRDREKYNALIAEAQGIARYWMEHKERVPPTSEQMRAMTQFEIAAARGDPRIAEMSVSDFDTMATRFLAPRDRERARKLFIEAKGNAARPGKVDAMDRSLLAQTAQSAWGPTKDWTQDQVAAFYRASEGVSEFIRANPKATPQQVQDEVTRWFLRGTVPGSGGLFFGDDETTTAEAAAASAPFEPEWTDEQRDQAQRALEAGGYPVDDRAIETYLRRRYGFQALPVPPEPVPEVEEEAAPAEPPPPPQLPPVPGITAEEDAAIKKRLFPEPIDTGGIGAPTPLADMSLK